MLGGRRVGMRKRGVGAGRKGVGEIGIKLGEKRARSLEQEAIYGSTEKGMGGVR